MQPAEVGSGVGLGTVLLSSSVLSLLARKAFSLVYLHRGDVGQVPQINHYNETADVSRTSLKDNAVWEANKHASRHNAQITIPGPEILVCSSHMYIRPVCIIQKVKIRDEYVATQHQLW